MPDPNQNAQTLEEIIARDASLSDQELWDKYKDSVIPPDENKKLDAKFESMINNVLGEHKALKTQLGEGS